MINVLILICFVPIVSICGPIRGESPDRENIARLLDQQVLDWNRGDIEGFMRGYWDGDSLVYIGKSSLIYGWTNVLNNYKKSYGDKKAMGTLSFDLISLDILSKDAAFVIGKWLLERDDGGLAGHFSLLLRKIEKRWLIVVDHSS